MKNNFNIKGSYKYKVLEKGKVIYESPKIDNLIVINDNPSGLYILFSRMLGSKTHDIEITSAGIGTSTDAPAITDTDLKEAVLKNIPHAQRSRIADDEISLEYFISDSELADDTYNEFGLYCGNKLFARSIISPAFIKSSGQDFSLEYTIKLS